MKLHLVCTLLSLAPLSAGAVTLPTISENTAGTYASTLPATDGAFTFYAGQSFTTMNDGIADKLDSICLLTTDGSASGSGSLYLFSSPYGGIESDLATTTTNLLGSAAWSTSSSCWDLSTANITLNAGTQYHFYIAPNASGLSFGFGSLHGNDAVDTYSGGQYYVATASSGTFDSVGSDLNFRVKGTAIPEPATYAGIAGVVALGVGLIRRRAKRQA